MSQSPRGGADAMRTWQPIETAPRDRTRILTPEGIAYWYEEPYVPGRWCLEGDSEAYTFSKPAHWMPLPDPPQNEEPTR